MTEAQNLFAKVAKAIEVIVPYALVKMIENSYRPGWDERIKPPQKTAGCFVFDAGTNLGLPTYIDEHRMSAKNIVFPKHDWLERIINETGFEDDKGQIWFFLPTNVLPNNKDTYWFRKIDFVNIATYANQIKSDKKELEKRVKAVLLIEEKIMKRS